MVRRIALILTLISGLAGLAWAGQLEDQQAEIADILQLVSQGVSEEVIIKHIEARGFVYDLTADEILDLRDRGVSEDVIAAMLDTAIDNQPSQRESGTAVERQDTSSDVYLSAGYFTPWYYYPYAWSYYYDPFPSLFSFYYYPFAFSIGWGWYGSSHYWYPDYWYGYGWCDPYYYGYASCHPGCWVPYPYSYGSRWESGHGLPNDRHTPGSRSYAGDSVERVRQAGRSNTREGQPVQSVREGATVSRTRQGQPATRVREGQPATQVRENPSRVRSGQSASRVRTPSASRGSEPAVRQGGSASRDANRAPRYLNRMSRDRVHLRSTTPNSSRPAERQPNYQSRRPAQSSAAPRSPTYVVPRGSGSSVRAPSSGYRMPQGGAVSRPSWGGSGSRSGGRMSAPSGAPHSGGGGSRR